MARSHFDLGNSSENASSTIWLEILRWILKPVKWLFESMEGLPEFVRWLVVALSLILLVALIAHITYTFFKAIRGPAGRRKLAYASAVQEVDPQQLEQEAVRAGNAGDYIGAIRLLFRAALRRIEAAENKRLRPGFTNRELLRRYRSTPLFGSLERFVETIDQKWYGSGQCLEDDYLSCRREHDRIRSYVQESRPALGA